MDCSASRRRRELKALINIHGADEGLGGRLTDDETKIISGVWAVPASHFIGGARHSSGVVIKQERPLDGWVNVHACSADRNDAKHNTTTTETVNDVCMNSPGAPAEQD